LKGATFDVRALRLPEKLYRARKRMEQMRAGKLPLPAGTSVESRTQELDRARAALIAGDLADAESLIGNGN
jgi:hypothetical protein